MITTFQLHSAISEILTVVGSLFAPHRLYLTEWRPGDQLACFGISGFQYHSCVIYTRSFAEGT